MSEALPQISNFKVSWKTRALYPLLKDWHRALATKEDVVLTKRHSNFLVVRVNPELRGIYTVFQSGFINCTGLRNVFECSEAVNRFKRWFGLHTVEGFKIDCISAHSNLGRLVDLRRVKNNHPLDLKADIFFSPEVFAGCLIRFSEKLEGTAYVFGSGKVTIVGGKNIRHINLLHQSVLHILHTSVWS